MEEFYLQIRAVHIGAVIASGLLFFARAAAHNVGSITVLTRLGFTEVSRNVDFAPGLGRDVEEIVFTLVPTLE